MHAEQRVAAVVLAAGASSRFGSRKQLARFGDGTMLDAVVAAARGGGLAPIVVVAPSDLDLPRGTRRAANDDVAAGLSHSLRLGLAAVPMEIGAAIVLLADQPTVSSSLLDRLVAARGAHPVVATHAGGVVGPPVLLERRAFRLAHEVAGDAGLRVVLRRRPELVTTVPLTRPLPDVDEPADLERLSDSAGEPVDD